MKKIVSFFILFFPVLVLSQSTDQNYIRSAVYKIPTTSVLPAFNADNAKVNVTYFDGLGRPIQQIAHKQSATGKDVITHIEYDPFGRQLKEYLPYASQSQSNMNYIDGITAKSETVAYYQTHFGDAFPVSEKRFENSPLNRVLSQGAPGSAWQLNTSHTIDFDYQTNGFREVRLFKVIFSSNNNYDPTLVAAGYYEKNELYKTIVTDENGSITEEFKDKEGRVVLKRSYVTNQDQFSPNHNNIEPADTYYVYDSYGNLTYVIPPKAADQEDINGVLNDLCYQYKYDYRNRLIEKKIPGKGWEYMVYDKLDRVVAVGPALSPFNNLSTNGWLITKYDVLGRVAYTGWVEVQGGINSSVRNNLQSNVNSMSNLYVTRVNSVIDGVQIGYSNNGTIPVITSLLTVNYYDNYSYPGAPTLFPTTIEGQPVTLKTQGLQTGSWVRVLTTTLEKLYELSYTLYDEKARPIRTYKKNHLGGFTQVDTKLDFIGNPLKIFTTHKYDSNITSLITVTEHFDYTPQGRLQQHTHQVNAGTVETLSYNEYNELGQLKIKKVGNSPTTPLQEVNYRYNIRGWLTDINNIDNLGSDLFAFKINYNTVHNTIGGIVKSQYNGNISEIFWSTSTDNATRKYGFAYDELNRLRDAWYQKPSHYGQNVLNNYNEHLSYDKNGNLLHLWRTGDLDNATEYIIIDNLFYTYDQGNILKKVIDFSNHPDGFTDGANNENEYGYDDYGNMTRDDNKGITSITYNHLNLPKEIVFDNNPNKKIGYLYNALGQKVQKGVMTSGTTFTITTYLEGFHYEMGNNTLFVNELKYFATAEGYVNVITKGIRVSYNYIYNYTDHLGNVRVSYTDNGGNATILEENHYYPFGLRHKKYGSVDKDLVCIDEEEEDCYEIGIDVVPPQARKPYQRKMQNKEWQDELGLNWYDFHARNYMPDIVVTPTIDPKSEMFYSQSPYSFLNNSPLVTIDPTGMEAEIADHIIVTKGKKEGTYVVKSGEANKDRGIYLDDGKGGKGEKVGTMMTTHSFFNEKDEAVAGAIIDMNSTDGQDFLDTVIKDNPSLFSYMINATNDEKYDFKAKGIKDRGNQTELQYKYRGSVTSDGEVGSARDFGNFAAGLVAARSGLSWKETRLGFDMYQGYKSNGIQFISVGGKPIPTLTPVSEAPTTIKAQMTGFLIGLQQYKR